MVGQRLEVFLKSCNLEAADVPKVVGVFVATKYAIGAIGLVVGFRYRPLQRLALRKSMVLQSNPWAQQQRLRLLEAWERAKRYQPKYSSSRNDVVAHKRTQTKQVDNSTARFRDARSRLRDAGQRLFLRRLMANRQLIEQARRSWYGWSSRKYWELTEKLQKAAGKSKFLYHVSAAFGTAPKSLALGLAEGVLLAKIAMPLTAPLSLLLIVQAFKGQQVVAISAEEHDEMEESAGSQ